MTGWNSDVLAQCSAASRSHLSKYTSALLILIIIWGVIGFCFAQRYIGLPWWGCSIVSLFLVTIVIMIERQIILTIGKSYSLLLFRAAIAFVMAIIGSTIFDQTLFGKDIDKQMANTIEVQVKDLTKKRAHEIDERTTSLRMEIDSLEKTNSMLQVEVNSHPFVTVMSSTITTSKVVMPDGKLKTVKTPSVTSSQVANPKQEIINTNIIRIENLRKEENKWIEKKQTVEEDVRKVCVANVGFLEELEAMWEIITTRKLAGLFYLVFFTFLMSLELFVVVSKLVDKQCDYEATIIGAQSVRIKQLGNVFKRVCA